MRMKRYQIYCALFFLLTIFLAACNPTESIEFNKMDSITVLYKEKNKPKDYPLFSRDEVTYPSDSKRYKALKTWLEANHGNWVKGVHGGDDVQIQVFGYGFILYVANDKVWMTIDSKDIMKSITPGEMSFLNKES